MKIFNRLSLAVLLMGATLIVFSFIPELEIWRDHFQYKINIGMYCSHPEHLGVFIDEDGSMYTHYHSNYKGWIWFLTGLALFIVQVIRVVFIFKDKDFNN